MMLDSIDSLTAQAGVLDARIADMCQPYQRQLGQLDEIPGFGTTTAQDLIAEIGTDMNVFPTAGHWLPTPGRPPGEGIRRQAQGQERHRPRQPLHRRRPRRGIHQRRPHPDLHRREIPAAHQAHAQAKSPGRDHAKPARHSSRSPADPDARYQDLGPDYYERKADIRRRARNHARALERLGYKVTLEAIDPGTGELHLVATAG
jgi:hypothetical protein